MSAASPSVDLLTGAIVVLVAAVIWFHLKKFTYWSSRNIKGPTPWPIFGTNFYYLFNNKLELDAKWHKKYGKVYGLYEGYSPLLRVNDNELINFIYVKQFRSFSTRHNEFIHDDLQKGWMLWNTGKEWAARRPLVSPLFASSKMKLMTTNMSECVNRFLREVERRSNELKLTNQGSSGANANGIGLVFSSNGQANGGQLVKSSEKEHKQLGGGGVAMRKADISAMTLDVIATNFYGLKLDTYRDKNNEFLKRAYDFATFDLGRFLVWALTPRQIAKALTFDFLPYSKFEYFDQLAKKIIKERRQVKDAGTTAQKRVDFVQAFMDARLTDTNTEQTNTGSKSGSGVRDYEKLANGSGGDGHSLVNEKPLTHLSDTEIRAQMNFLFIAGFETTAQTLNFCLYELAHQPDTQEQLYSELRRVFEANLHIVASTNEHFPSEHYSDLMELTLLDAFISESLRLYSPIIESNRRAEEPIVLATQPEPLMLPEGMPITTNSFIVHRDPDYWPEPNKFDLTRFLPENRDKIKPGSYLPFGLGSRTCLGMRFASLEIKLALAKIILNYHIAPVSQEYPPKFQQNFIFLLPVKNDFQLIARAG
uniref:Cytochrome P450 3A25 n=1 Tax=Aceria tosichella TaxID=561515 RepID=A0A6G1S5N6_9ACAR